MNLQLDHFFILVDPGAKVADLLVEIGMIEGPRNLHQGQGTSNRRLYFSNGMLEFLWMRDAQEAYEGTGRELCFSKRASNPAASPFGIILTRKDNTRVDMPFEGWKYQPDYFDPPMAFPVGENASNLSEPLCIYVPFVEPGSHKDRDVKGKFQQISSVTIHVVESTLSHVLHIAGNADRLTFECGDQHLMEVTFNDRQSGSSKDFRPDIPLIIHC